MQAHRAGGRREFETEVLRALLEPLPDSLREALGAETRDGRINVAVATDFLTDGVYGQEWLVVTRDRLRVYPAGNGHASNGHRLRQLGRRLVRRRVDGAPLTPRLDVPLTAVRSPRAESLVGGGALEATIDGQAVELVRYSNARQRVFGQVGKYLDDLVKHREAVAKGEAKDEPTIEEDTDAQKRCARCRLLLPEGTTICPACVNKTRVLVRLLGYLRPYRRHVALLTLMLLGSTGIGLISPYLVRPLMDVVLVPVGEPLPVPRRAFWLGMIVAGMLFSQAVAHAINIAQGRTAAWVTHQLAHALRLELYQHLQKLSLRFFDKRQTGALMSRVTQDTHELESVLTIAAQFIIAQILTLAGVIVILCVLDWRLFLCVLAPLPLVMVAWRLAWRRLNATWPRWWHFRARLNAVLNDTLTGVRVVKAFAQEDREVGRFTPHSRDVAEAGMAAERTWMTVFPIVGFITGLGALIVWYIGGRSVLSGGLTLGVLSTFIAYLGMLYGPLQTVNQAPRWFGQVMAAAERVFDILDTAPDVPDIAAPVRMPRIEGRVQFENVTFGYDPHKPVLQGVGLDVAAGEMIGLVGHSGAGKSTTINLLCRFYDPGQGRILIDGVDIRQIAQKDLRSQIGLVLQDTFLFNGTIAENIGYAKPGATREQIMAAARAANAHDFVAGKPDGYDTPVGERGGALSGGERQRIAIARAILHNPRILILDEATSSVDTDTEKQIQDAIARLVQGRTTFAIAHRLSTLRNANRLVVLKGGKIEEVGTHDELLTRKGEFHRLVEVQQEMSRIKAVARQLGRDMTAEAPSVTDTTTLRYLDPARLRFFRRGATLRLTVEGEASHLSVSVLRLFPLSEPSRYLSLRGGDGKEIGVLTDPATLDAHGRALIDQELRRRYIVPVIQRVLGVKERFGTLDWRVLTDRGPCGFTTRGLRENTVNPSPGRYLLSDVDGNRYDIPDLAGLDGMSRAYVLRYL